MQKVLSCFCLTFFLLFLLFSHNQAFAEKKPPSFLHTTIINQLIIIHLLGLKEYPQTLGYKLPKRVPTPILLRKKAVLPLQKPPTAQQPTLNVASFILQGINAYRATQGLSSVQMSGEVCAFAATRAQEIVSSFTHDGFRSRTDAKTLPYGKWSSVTENIAMTSNYQEVVKLWENSSGHAANMRADTPFVCVQQAGNYFAYEGMRP